MKISQENKIILCNKNSHLFFEPKSFKLFRLYIFYLFLLCASFYFFDFHSTEEKVFLDAKEVIKTIETKKFEYLSKEILYLYEKANINKIKIINLEFTHLDALLKIEAKSKDKIYKFCKDLNNNKVKEIKYDSNLKKFIADVSFQIIRK